MDTIITDDIRGLYPYYILTIPIVHQTFTALSSCSSPSFGTAEPARAGAVLPAVMVTSSSGGDSWGFPERRIPLYRWMGTISWWKIVPKNPEFLVGSIWKETSIYCMWLVVTTETLGRGRYANSGILWNIYIYTLIYIYTIIINK